MPDAPSQPPIVARLASEPLCAGFPSPSADYDEERIDLARLLSPAGRAPLLHAGARRDGPSAAYVVDTSAAPRPGDLALVEADGRPGLARIARGPGGRPVPTGRGGAPLRAGRATCLGVATWRLLAMRGGAEALASAGLSALGADGPAAFLFRVSGHSMSGAGIGDGDLLLVDRAERPRHGDVVVAVSGGARSVKRLLVEGGRAFLAFENAAFPDPLPFAPETALFGVATWALRRLRA